MANCQPLTAWTCASVFQRLVPIILWLVYPVAHSCAPPITCSPVSLYGDCSGQLLLTIVSTLWRLLQLSNNDCFNSLTTIAVTFWRQLLQLSDNCFNSLTTIASTLWRLRRPQRIHTTSKRDRRTHGCHKQYESVVPPGYNQSSHYLWRNLQIGNVTITRLVVASSINVSTQMTLAFQIDYWHQITLASFCVSNVSWVLAICR
jgi:hypothetical protein